MKEHTLACYLQTGILNNGFVLVCRQNNKPWLIAMIYLSQKFLGI